jgi:hypothetical protein
MCHCHIKTILCFLGCNASFDGLVCWPSTIAGDLARVPCTSIEAFRQLQVNYVPGTLLINRGIQAAAG